MQEEEEEEEEELDNGLGKVRCQKPATGEAKLLESRGRRSVFTAHFPPSAPAGHFHATFNTTRCDTSLQFQEVAGFLRLLPVTCRLRVAVKNESRAADRLSPKRQYFGVLPWFFFSI